MVPKYGFIPFFKSLFVTYRSTSSLLINIICLTSCWRWHQWASFNTMSSKAHFDVTAKFGRGGRRGRNIHSQTPTIQISKLLITTCPDYMKEKFHYSVKWDLILAICPPISVERQWLKVYGPIFQNETI